VSAGEVVLDPRGGRSCPVVLMSRESGVEGPIISERELEVLRLRHG
jgi:hypothetical protein